MWKGDDLMMISNQQAGSIKALGRIEGFASLDRLVDSCIPAEERLHGFGQVVNEMDEESASQESMRCLQCDLRLNITSVKFWGNY